MDPATRGLRPEADAQQDGESGGVTELQLCAVHHKAGEALVEAPFERLAQQIGGVVIELTRRGHDGAGALFPHLDP
jgi:hypothetical protein